MCRIIRGTDPGGTDTYFLVPRYAFPVLTVETPGQGNGNGKGGSNGNGNGHRHGCGGPTAGAGLDTLPDGADGPDGPEAPALARDEAAEILAAARAEAAALLARARDEAAAEAAVIREEARRDGYAEGRREGRRAALEEAAAEAQALRRQARAVLEQAEEIRRSTLAGLEDELVTLALEMAGRIVAAQLTAEPATVLAIVKEALEAARVREQAVLYVNPADEAMVQAHRAELTRGLPPGAALQVIADEAVAAGGCRVATGDGQVETSLAARWQALTHALREPAEETGGGRRPDMADDGENGGITGAAAVGF
ncbi:hypothetical protein A6M21_14595 [Desulfotomaculum copahuensis]|uniref:Flagellar assembly protein FliH/Type III secretion system HrpE domain-containing protein n=1 Tax=Desulfotomaculum copahuensis TaxID=1838280 RepID=A0A1B7LBM7_9FIRM|nr:hypothetical protein A6M21_14595 [Desulfotomaculum copahuensis]